MNQYLKYALTVAVTAAAMVAYQYEGKPEHSGLAQQAPTQVTEIKNDIAQVEQPITQETTTDQTELNSVDLADIDPASIDWKAMNRRLGTHAMINPTWGLGDMEVGVFSAKEIAAYNNLHVVPFNPLIDMVCSQKTEPSEVFIGFGEICMPVLEHPEHSYAKLPINELRELAYSDAEAAAFVSRKAEDNSEAAYFSMRAAAISGKSGPLIWLAQDKYNNTELSDHFKDYDGNASVRINFGRRLALETLAAEMGDPRADPKFYLDRLEQTFGDKAEKVRASNLRAVDLYKKEIDKIRQQIGLSQLFEGGDKNA